MKWKATMHGGKQQVRRSNIACLSVCVFVCRGVGLVICTLSFSSTYTSNQQIITAVLPRINSEWVNIIILHFAHFCEGQVVDLAWWIPSDRLHIYSHTSWIENSTHAILTFHTSLIGAQEKPCGSLSPFTETTYEALQAKWAHKVQQRKLTYSIK